MLNDAEFDKLIAGKFPPMRRRSEPMDFEPTIAVDRPDPEDVQACSHCKGKCPTPQACGLDSEFGAIEGMVKGAKWILAPWFVMTVIAAVLWAWWFV